MKRLVVISMLVLVMLAVAVVPALAATPANNGAGRAFGVHISTEAKAGTLGPDIHPGQHTGFAGWVMP